MNDKPVKFNNTVLRDGHQSLAATRMSTAQMLPLAPDLDAMGFHGLETWGGATIDSCLRYLGENPFDRLRKLKEAAPRTPHIMLLRGQNIVQYTSFPDDVVEAFVRCTAEAGMDVFRIFDALNDIRNLKTAIKAVKKAGKHARGELCYTISPVHTVESFVDFGVQLEKLGCDSIGIKDMAGILVPDVAARLVKGLKQKTNVPVILHCHDTGGLAAESYMAAIDAGVDVVEVSIAPMANGTAQPDCVRMLTLLQNHPRAPIYNIEALEKMREKVEKVYQELSQFTNPKNERVDSNVLVYQVPGGMLSNFRNQLKEQGLADKFDEVVEAIPIVREKLGWIPLVTPTSQIVGTQAMLNIKFGPWRVIAEPVLDIVLGKYGKTPGPIDPEILEKVKKQTGKTPSTERPGDLIPPRMESLRKEIREKGLPESDEIAVLYAMFPQQVMDLYKPADKSNGQGAPKAAPAAPAAAPDGPSEGAYRLAITVNGTQREVVVEEIDDGESG